MLHRLSIFALLLLLGEAALAQISPPSSMRPQPVAPAVPPPPIFSNKPSLLNSPISALNPPPRTALDPYPHQPGTWDRLQDSVDRSTGRIVDEQLYQLDRLARLRYEREGLLRQQSEFDRLQEERERRLRIEQQARQHQLSEQQIRNELDRREYELFVGRDGYSTPLTGQTMADEQTLLKAKTTRDEQILAANDARAEALRQNPGNSQRIESDYQQKAQHIRAEYEQVRQRILGFPAPATQPTSAPAAP
jgi:hypothetical protein